MLEKQFRLPVGPNLVQALHQAKDLLRKIREGDASAVQVWNMHRHGPVDSRSTKLADAQFVLARLYEAPNWRRLVLACKLIEAIWQNQPGIVRQLILKHPHLLHENALIRDSNWGPPTERRSESWAGSDYSTSSRPRR